MATLAELRIELKKVKREIALRTNGGNYCKYCFTTKVYWTTIDRPYLFNTNGTGQHVCSGPRAAPYVDTAALIEEGFTNEEEQP